jgi:hypothetical protein
MLIEKINYMTNYTIGMKALNCFEELISINWYLNIIITS